MKLLKTKIDGPKILKTTIFKDSRGFFKEVYRKKIIGKLDFPFDIMSYSKKNVLRGMHIQTKKPQAKIITVTHGKILDVAVDLRKKSKTYKKYYKIILSSENCKSIYIPEGFAHGFLSLDVDNMIVYHLTNYRSKKDEIGIKWNDKILNITWGRKKPILSPKDATKNISFLDFERKYNY